MKNLKKCKCNSDYCMHCNINGNCRLLLDMTYVTEDYCAFDKPQECYDHEQEILYYERDISTKRRG